MVALAAALVPAAALLFAAGVWVGGSSRAPRATVPAPENAATRQVYSPQVLDDPWFLERQRENAAALERECAQRGQFCAEARDMRRWLDENGG